MSATLTLPLLRPGSLPPQAEGGHTPSAARDEQTFTELYEAHVGRIHAHIRARVGDPHLAEDLTAQTFLRAWQSIERYRPIPGRPFIAWLFTIANNLIVDHYRRHRRELIGVKGDHRDNGVDDPERCALATDLRDEIRRAVAGLKAEHQLVVSLRLVEGLDYTEISAITGKTPGALRVMLCRALSALRHELEQRGVRPA